VRNRRALSRTFRARGSVDGTFRAAFEHAPIAIALLGAEGHWLHANRAFCELLGYSEDELRQLTFAEMTHPDDVAESREQVRRRLAGETVEQRTEKRYIRADGRIVWVDLTGEVVRDDAGRPLYLVVHVEDITQRRETERQLREAEERFRRAFEDAPIGMALVSPDGRFLRVNHRLCEITGYTEEALLDRTFQEITYPDDLDSDLHLLRACLGGEIRTYQLEKRYIRRDGSIVWVKLSVTLVRSDDGTPLYFVSEIEDITERKRTERELQRLANYDALTGLGNRRKLIADLEHLVTADAGEERLLVIFDLNGFKQYNDAFGHPAGDTLLARLAAKLQGAAHPHGKAYRLGGDEFCVLAAPPASETDALLTATVTALEETGDGFAISAAFGAAFVPGEAADPSSALSLADQRLYAQKNVLHGQRGQLHDVLLRAIWEHEPSLREHISEVTALSVAVGARLGMTPDALDDLRLAAELHDVGKLAVPDAVLRKPGPLNDAEWDLMRQHTLIGQRILSASPALRSIGVIVRSTHERWDGKGYADGLAGTEIPLAARIVAACDAYAAMTSERPYRRPMSPTEATAELRASAGTQFDPAVVEAVCAELLDPRAAGATRVAIA
jgi:PAS domain S-box-containing protein/diguanylate cyclase (GGDEF)-like protein